ncbi:MAG: hypothetical protein U0269_23145 [Polyangiales bacterium]
MKFDGALSLRVSRGLALTLASVVGVACSTNNPAPDASQDAQVEAALDAAADRASDVQGDAVLDSPSDAQDAETDATAAVDAGVDALDEGASDAAVDAAADAAPTPLLLLGATGNAAMPAYGSSFASGSWATVTALTGSDCYGPGGGGVTVMRDGRGLAVIRSNGTALPYSAVWSAGRWSGATATGGTLSSFVSGPVATALGAAYVRQSGSGASNLRVDTWASATSSWTSGATLELLGDNRGVPAVAVTESGQQLVIDGDSRGGYRWLVGGGATWSALTTVGGAVVPAFDTAAPAVAAVGRAGVDEIVAAFLVEGATRSSARIAWASFRAGAWSAVSNLASDVVASRGVTAPFVLAPLRDGRVALAYLTASSGVSVGFYDGASWTAFRAVAGVTSIPQASPFGLARGADATAVLELVYLDTARRLRHTRLTNEPNFTWSTPSTIDSARQWLSVWIAAGL